MLYIFILLMTSLATDLSAGPNQSRQTVHPIAAPTIIYPHTIPMNVVVNNSYSSTNDSTYDNTNQALYFKVTIQEFNKQAYNSYKTNIQENSSKMSIYAAHIQKPTPLATLTAIFASRKNYNNKPIQYCVGQDSENKMEFNKEEKTFIHNAISDISSPTNMILCKPIKDYAHQPDNVIRYLSVTCPHDLNPDYQSK